MFIGTTNPGKTREIAAICSQLGIPLGIISLDILENGISFEENAILKAIGYANNIPDEFVIVEDSGLVIPYLGGLPGPWSARFSDFNIETKEILESNREREEIDLENNNKILNLLHDVPFEKRAAYFEICFIVAKNNQIHWKSSTKAYGWIAEEMKGNNGFGYDPIFIGNDTFGKTYAELDSFRKNLRSHRNIGLRNFEAWAAGCLKEGIKL